MRHRGKIAGSLLLSAGLLAAVVSAPALASTHHSAMHPKGTKIATRATKKYGRVVANTKGRVMYRFLGDKTSVSHCNGACASIWPHVTSKGKPVAGAGISAKHLRRNAKGQVTYYGHPLYYFADGKSPGNTSGEGLNTFYVVGVHGAAIKTAKKKPAKAAGPTGPAVVTTHMAGGVTVLANKTGRTLYALTDPNEMATFWCAGSCLSTWVPLLTKGAPTAAGGAASGMLSTVKRSGVGTQVTYNGYPLYRYTGDTAAGQDNGEGLTGPYAYASPGQVWDDMTSDGNTNP